MRRARLCYHPGIMTRLTSGLARGLIAGLLFLLSATAETADPPPSSAANTTFLAGQFLVATTRIGDPRFAKTVIYMVAHDDSGAVGLIVNRVYGKGRLDKFLEGFSVEPHDAKGDILLRYGGPVEPSAGFVLHTADYRGPGTRVVNERMAMTSEISVLKAIADGKGPNKTLFALGYAGWGPGQLEGEIARGDWLSAPADEGLIFDGDADTMWDRVSGQAGIKL
jgi:putative transcriptional regulator